MGWSIYQQPGKNLCGGGERSRPASSLRRHIYILLFVPGLSCHLEFAVMCPNCMASDQFPPAVIQLRDITQSLPC